MAKLTLSSGYRTLKVAIQRTHLLLIATLLAACSADPTEVAYREGQRIIQPLNLEWQDGGDDYHRGTSIYRRQLALNDSYNGKRLFLHFDGAAIATEVFVNGTLAGSHEGSYGTFRFDIAGLLDPTGSNQLEVRVSNAVHDHVAPLSADFTFFGGLYRRLRLIAANPVHVEAMNRASSGVFWTQQMLVDEITEPLGLRFFPHGPGPGLFPQRGALSSQRHQLHARFPEKRDHCIKRRSRAGHPADAGIRGHLTAPRSPATGRLGLTACRRVGHCGVGGNPPDQPHPGHGQFRQQPSDPGPGVDPAEVLSASP